MLPHLSGQPGNAIGCGAAAAADTAVVSTSRWIVVSAPSPILDVDAFAFLERVGEKKSTIFWMTR